MIESKQKALGRQLLLTIFLLAGVTGAALAAQGEQGQDRFISNVRQLLYEGRRSGECYFSPDGRELVFMSEREPGNPFFQIFALNFDTGDVKRVSTGRGKTTCPFFQFGTGKIEYASTQLDPEFDAKAKAEYQRRKNSGQRKYTWDYDENYDIFVARPDGTIEARLTDARGYDAEGAYSPDGSKIVFCSLRGAFPLAQLSEAQQKLYEQNPAYFGEIYIMDADGSGQTRLTDWPGYDGGPFFTPDGERIVWRHFTEDGSIADVYTMRLDGSDRRRLTDFGAMSFAPFFHPSGAYCIFTTNTHGFDNFELYMVDALGLHEPVRVTHRAGFDGLPVFSPDGERLVWTSNQTDTKMSQIFLSQWDHKAAQAAIASAPLRGGAHPTPTSTSRDSRPSPAAFSADISTDDLRANVEFLASDELAGRLTGTAGAQRAASYIEGALRRAGLQPIMPNGSFFQPFEFVSGVRKAPGGNRLKMIGASGSATTPEPTLGEEFQPLTYSGNGVAEGEIVFAGYGLVEPNAADHGYDSYAGLDVTGKVVLALRDLPEDVSPKRRQELSRYAGDRYKAKLAADRGALAFLLVTGPNSPSGGELVRFRERDRTSSVGIPAMTISGDLADQLLGAADMDLKALQTALDSGERATSETPVLGARVAVEVTLERVRGQGRNVLAVLPPTDGSDEYVVVGAHYDHIGNGIGLGSLASPKERGQIHNGADDNASGVSVVLELAAWLASAESTGQSPPKRRGVIFALWSGEELGLIGSSHFVNDPPVPAAQMVAYFNFDMVGRLRDNRLIVQALGSSPIWRRLIERRNIPAGFNLSLQDDPYLPTDSTAFYNQGVPCLSFFTDLHDDYNKPSDDANTLNIDGMARVARFAGRLVEDVRDPALEITYAKVQRSAAPPSRMGRRTYTGIIPHFAGGQDVEGMLVSDVKPGGPADLAGLRGGDVIVEFAGAKIASLRDYADALVGAKIGQAVPVVAIRDGQRMTFSMTPVARRDSGRE